MPAIAEHTVVCPVGSGSADADHCDPVNKEHDQCEDRKTEPAVGDDLIYLIGGGESTGLFLLVAVLDELCYVNVALVGDDALGIVVKLGLGCLDIALDMLHNGSIDLELSKSLVVALEDLYRVPALLILRHGVQSRFLDVSDSVLDRAGEGVHRNGLAVLCSVDSGLGSVHNAVALQSGDLNDLAAELTGELFDVYLVALLADDIHHVDGDHHGDAKLSELSGEVEVTLKVRAVDDVEYRIGTLGYQVVTGDDFFKRVRGQRVYTGKVHDDDVIVLLEAAFLLFNGDSGPVADELVGAGQRIEQRCFTAVGVACEGNFDLLIHD